MDDAPTNESAPPRASRFAWAREATRYQWLVLIVATLGMAFDIMDATLYVVVQKPALRELLGPEATVGRLGVVNSFVFATTLAGWAIGGIACGVASDYFGRARVMVGTILLYSVFTGLCALPHTWWELAGCRFIVGIGLGGEWAAGAALVAEVWPDRHRAKAGAILVTGGRLGILLAAGINAWVGPYSWRYVFIVGALPALLIVLVRMFIKEPDAWVEANARRLAAKRTGAPSTFSLQRLFWRDLRKDVLVATGLAAVGLTGVWGAAQWVPGAIRELVGPTLVSLPLKVQEAKLAWAASSAVILIDAGGVLGNFFVGYLVDRVGRRGLFLVFFLGGLLTLPTTFLATSSTSQIYVLLPLVGFWTYGVLSAFPIYLPELFPVQVRASGAGFSYNAGRILTVLGVLGTGQLIALAGSTARAVGFVGFVYVIGLAILPFARETRGQRLS